MNQTRQITTWAALILFLLTSSVHAATYYFHNDHLGTPQVLTDENQAKVWQGEYNPFGEVIETVALVEQNLRFPGQYLDRESGLHYNYFRTYNPTIGRYTQSDPIGLGGGINTYAYVSSNPVNKFDIYGLAEICNVGIPFSVGVPHTFLCANGQCGGKHSSGSGPALYSPISQIQDDLSDKPEASCSIVPEKDCDPVSFDACVTQKLQVRQLNEPYFFAGQNCGTWVAETILECRKTCKKSRT